MRSARNSWRDRGWPLNEDGRTLEVPRVGSVATVTFANGGDNIGVYVPVFATVGTTAMLIYVAVFLVMVAIWCAVGFYLATRPIVARALSRWGHILMPVVLIAIGVLILVEGHAFGL